MQERYQSCLSVFFFFFLKKNGTDKMLFVCNISLTLEVALITGILGSVFLYSNNQNSNLF